MLTHCCILESFSMSTMVPIPKRGAGSMTDVKHYGGIIFDNQIITIDNDNDNEIDLFRHQ